LSGPKRLILRLDDRENGREVLKDINVTIHPGKHVAICGRSGSGKSSLISVLLRILEPSKGIIVIGEKDISQYTQQAICSRLTAMPQDAWFVPRGCANSVRKNLDPSQEIHDDALIFNVLEKTGLRDQVDRMGGLDATLNPGDGVKLSEGQKQLFCLARAMLKKSGGIFIMDEALSRLLSLSFFSTICHSSPKN
jgi:ABC-type multidrug transport system fused ATPase/permease subunit